MAALMIAVIMLMRVLQSLFTKKAAMVLPAGRRPYIAYVAVSNLFSAVFGLALLLPGMNFAGMTGTGLLIASCSGLCLALNSICSLKALMGGSIALNSIFGTAGMILPILLGVFVFAEPVSAVQMLCIAVLFGAVMLMVLESRGTGTGMSASTLVWLIGSFLSNGMVMFCQKLFGELYPEGNVSMFSMLTFLVPAVVFALLLLPRERSAEGATAPLHLPRSLILFAAILAFAVFVIQQLVTILTPMMSAAILFTLVNGGATVIAALVGAVAYREKITPRSAVGIVLGIGAMVCIQAFV